MECQQQLPLDPKAAQDPEHKNQILQYYFKQDLQKHKRNKSTVFSIQSINGLLSLLNIKLSKIQFLSPEEVSSEINLFLQNGKKNTIKNGEVFSVEEHTFAIVIDGRLTRNDVDCTDLKNYKIRKDFRKNTARFKDAIILTAALLKKAINKDILVNEKTEPKTIHYNMLENSNFQAKIDTTIIVFPSDILKKIDSSFEKKQKNALIQFLCESFDIENKKIIQKFLPKIKREFINSKRDIETSENTIYIIFNGEYLLKTQDYQAIIGRNGLIYEQSKKSKCQLTAISIKNIVFSIQMDAIRKLLSDLNEDIIMLAIEEKLLKVKSNRTELHHRNLKLQLPNKLIEPVFDTEILNMRKFTKKSQVKLSEEHKINRLWAPKSSSAKKTTRFRIIDQYEENIDSKSVPFLSEYAYEKFIESQQIANHLIGQAHPITAYRPFSLGANRKRTIEQEIQQKKEIKLGKYNDKVRRLKIKNIAQRQIPNGYRRKFDIQGAQQEISKFLLFNNVFEERKQDGEFINNEVSPIKGHKVIHKKVHSSQINYQRNIDNLYGRSQENSFDESINFNLIRFSLKSDCSSQNNDTLLYSKTNNTKGAFFAQKNDTNLLTNERLITEKKPQKIRKSKTNATTQRQLKQNKQQGFDRKKARVLTLKIPVMFDPVCLKIDNRLV